jgi:preprotein translocase subunit YajC
LRCRAEETSWTGTFRESHVEVVRGDEIEIHSGVIGELQNFEMTFVEIDIGTSRMIMLLHVIEKAEFHRESPFSSV